MSIKVKGFLSVVLVSFSFFMCLDTKYSRGLGDYILEFMGLKSWSSGLHLTVIYFGIILIIGIFLIEKYVILGQNIKRWKAFLAFVLVVTIFYLIIAVPATYIKGNSYGLLSIGYDKTNEGHFSCQYSEDELQNFNATFELTNYSEEQKEFYIQIIEIDPESKFHESFTIYNEDNELAMFKLRGKETKSFRVSSDEYSVVRQYESKDDILIQSWRGTIKEFILSNQEGNKVKLQKGKFFGAELSR